MPTIVEIKKDSPGTYALILMDEGAVTRRSPLIIPKDLFVTGGYAKGQVIDDEDLNALVYAINCYQIELQAVRLLSYSSHFCAQLRLKLLQRQFDQALVDQVLLTLQDKGYLDDQQTAENWVQSHQDKKSPAVMAATLSQYGLSPSQVAQALSTISIDPKTVLMDKALKKWHSLKGSGGKADPKAREKLLQYLIRQGFSYQEAKWAFQEIDEME